MQELFSRSFDSLEEIFAFTEHFFTSERIDRQHWYTVNLAIDELFTNMVKYNPAGGEKISLQMQRTGAVVEVRLRDPGATPFDVTRPRAVDPSAPAEARKSGGLGLYLVQQLVDSLDYSYRDGASTVTFTRKLG
jgi:anti-sigma regulatory factor (Ser/Thr protein kinase)